MPWGWQDFRESFFESCGDLAKVRKSTKVVGGIACQASEVARGIYYTGDGATTIASVAEVERTLRELVGEVTVWFMHALTGLKGDGPKAEVAGEARHVAPCAASHHKHHAPAAVGQEQQQGPLPQQRELQHQL